MTRILLIGNCHAHGLARALEAMTGADVAIARVDGSGAPMRWSDVEFGLSRLYRRLWRFDERYLGDFLKRKLFIEKPDRPQFIKADFFRYRHGHSDAELDWQIGRANIVAVLSTFADAFLKRHPHLEGSIERIPHLHTTAFHPDCVTANSADGPIRTLMNFHHSAIALHGFLNGLGLEETLALYNAGTFERLGYFGHWDRALAWAAEQERQTGWPLPDMYRRWLKEGAFMHTPNHPTLTAFSHLARYFAEKHGLPVHVARPDRLLFDNDTLQEIWPVYPEIADRLGFEGDYRFKLPEGVRAKTGRRLPVIELREFVADSFERYARIGREAIRADIPPPEKFRVPSSPFAGEGSAPKPRKAASGDNPYAGLPDERFWNRSVAGVPAAAVDPVARGLFRIRSGERVATAGSCFAQHISRTLAGTGLPIFDAEPAPDGLAVEEAARRHYGIYSARYGNIYSARQLLQLFGRAFGQFSPADNAWLRPDGRYADPFRPSVEPDGYETEADVAAARAGHLAAVRRMFETLDVFIFTLGLTEAWHSVADGAVFPMAPGVAAGAPDPARYVFVNFDAAMVEADLVEFISRLRGVNPKARVILTVSPVPLIATYEDRHVVVSTAYSKAALRVAAEAAASRLPDVAYFPSYEIITSNFSRGAYFMDDLRSISPDGVAHAMRLFLKHYVEKGATADLSADFAAAAVVCDEDALGGAS